MPRLDEVLCPRTPASPLLPARDPASFPLPHAVGVCGREQTVPVSAWPRTAFPRPTQLLLLTLASGACPRKAVGKPAQQRPWSPSCPPRASISEAHSSAHLGPPLTPRLGAGRGQGLRAAAGAVQHGCFSRGCQPAVPSSEVGLRLYSALAQATPSCLRGSEAHLQALTLCHQGSA